MLRKYCELKSILIFQVYLEDHSAKTFKRPVWNKVLVDLRKNKGIDLVLFTKWDRFSRNTGDAYHMIGLLRRFGIEPQAIEQPLDLSVPENKMMLAFYLAIPEVENDRRSMNILGGQRRARKEGRWPGAAPVGYTNHRDEQGKKCIILKEPNASIMRWTFEQVANGTFSMRQIFDEAVRRGINCGEKNFYHMIRNPVYCGKVLVPKSHDEDEYFAEGQHEALISEALYYRVQEIVNKRKRAGTKIVSEAMLPLRGFLVCPNCNRNLTASTSKGRKDHYYYYHCQNSCEVRHRAEEVNRRFALLLMRYMPRPGYNEFYAEMIRRAFKLKADIVVQSRKDIMGEIQALYDKINKARELALIGDFEMADFKKVKLDNERQIKVLEASLPELNLATRNIDSMLSRLITNLYRIENEWDSMDLPRKRLVISAIFPESWVYDGEKHRTARVNEIALNIKLINSQLRRKKTGQRVNFTPCPVKWYQLGSNQ
jgi:site-specific DNA recombinase